MTRYLVTGAAGFIGYHVANHLLARGDEVVGVDNLNEYYEVSLKRDRLAQLQPADKFRFVEFDLAVSEKTDALISEGFDIVIHLAAQAGVRYSLENPHAYIQANLVAFANVLEACRHHQVKHLTYASSSSVYGLNATKPFSVNDNVDHPVSLYAASKKSNELMAHTYSHLFGLPTTGLRFFTVYGPWGRPDMALFKFTRKILAGEPIDVYNHGKMKRDFTYIDDIAAGVIATADHTATPNPDWDPANPDPASSSAPYRIYNIGNNQPVELEYFVSTLEAALGIKAERNYQPMQPGDVLETFADIDSIQTAVGFQPIVPIGTGVERFVAWYRNYYQ